MTHGGTTQYPEGLTPLLTVSRLAELLDVERKTIYRLPLPYIVVGSRRRYRSEDVEAFLEARKVAAG